MAFRSVGSTALWSGSMACTDLLPHGGWKAKDRKGRVIIFPPGHISSESSQIPPLEGLPPSCNEDETYEPPGNACDTNQNDVVGYQDIVIVIVTAVDVEHPLEWAVNENKPHHCSVTDRNVSLGPCRAGWYEGKGSVMGSCLCPCPSGKRKYLHVVGMDVAVFKGAQPLDK